MQPTQQPSGDADCPAVESGASSEPKRTSQAPAFFRARDESGAPEEVAWLYGDMKDEDLEKMKADCEPSHWFIISPWSPLRISWDVVGLLMIITDAYMTTFELSFLAVWSDGALPITWDVITWIVTAFFAADICLNFITGQQHQGSNSWVVMRLEQIAVMYIKTWFVLDVLATIPWDRLLDSGNDAGSSKVVRFGRFNKSFRLIKFIRLLRLLRIIRGISKVSALMASMHGRPLARRVVQLAAYLLAFVIVCHLHACVFHALSPDFMEAKDTLFAAYLASFYWVWIHLLTTAAPDAPSQDGVFILSIVLSMQSMVLLIAGLAKVTNIVLQLNEQEAKRLEDVNAANDFMKANSVSSLLQFKVQRYLKQAKRTQMVDMRGLLGDAPLLYEELCLDVHGAALRTFPVILDLENEQAHGDLLVSRLAVRVTHRTWAPNEIIFSKGDRADAMLMVLEGSIRVLRACLAGNKHVQSKLRHPHGEEDGSECTCGLDLLFPVGTWVGEKSLFLEGQCRFNTARSDAFTTALVLRGEDFQAVCRELRMWGKVEELMRGFDTGLTFQSAGCPFCGRTSHWGNQCMHVLYQEVGTASTTGAPGQRLSPAGGRRSWGARALRRSRAEAPKFAELEQVLAAEGFGGLDDPMLADLTPEDVTRIFGARGLRAVDLARLRRLTGQAGSGPSPRPSTVSLPKAG